MTRVFPPALVPVLRDVTGAESGALAELDDDVLGQLLTTVYFAGLETYEGEHGPIRVVLIGRTSVDLILPEGAGVGAAPVYCWKILRFEHARPFAIAELVKLAVASAHERIYTAIALVDGALAIAGLAREGLAHEADPFLQVVAERPGCLSIRRGRNRLAEYERGAIVTGGEDVVLAHGPVRRALELAARAADMEPGGFPDYLHAVHALVAEMASHGRGGLLVISPEPEPHVAKAVPYRMTRDSSITSMLRLSRRLRRSDDATSYGFLLRNAFSTELQRMIEEYGALTAIDGATVLNCALALVAFGVILPVATRTVAIDVGGADADRRRLELGARGTRHRAGATFARDHAGSVVFVASEDGQISCMVREPPDPRVLVWRLGSATGP